MNTRFDEWVTAHQGEIALARKYVREHGPNAAMALASDRTAMRPERRAEIADALPFAVLDEAAERLGTHLSVDAVYEDERVRRFYEITTSAGGLPARTGAAIAQVVCKQEVLFNWHLVAHARSGNWKYEVSPNLAGKLRCTDLHGLTCDDLRLPHAAILIVVPESADLTMSAPDSTTARVTEIYVVEAPLPERRWHLFALGQGDATEAKRFFALGLPEGGSIDESVALTDAGIDSADRPLLVNGRTLSAASRLLASDSKRAAMANWEPLFRWAMNVVVYATNNGERLEIWENEEAERLRERVRELHDGREKKALKLQLKALDPRRRILLGPNVQPLPPAPGGQGRPQLVRTLVQGHWKRQPCGPGWASRKLIFIDPYWRGAEELPPAPGGVHVLV